MSLSPYRLESLFYICEDLKFNRRIRLWSIREDSNPLARFSSSLVRFNFV